MTVEDVEHTHAWLDSYEKSQAEAMEKMNRR